MPVELFNITFVPNPIGASDTVISLPLIDVMKYDRNGIIPAVTVPVPVPVPVAVNTSPTVLLNAPIRVKSVVPIVFIVYS